MIKFGRLFAAVFFVMVLLTLGGGAVAVSDSYQQSEQKSVGTVSVTNNPQWLEAKAHLRGDLTCQEKWDILWHWAKLGNLDARAILFKASYIVWPGALQIMMPGSNDELSIFRDAVILGIHSIGVKHESRTQQNIYDEHFNFIFRDVLNNLPKGNGLLSCLKQGNASKCVHYATQPTGTPGIKLVPTFEDYALEIDARRSRGAEPMCLHVLNVHDDVVSTNKNSEGKKK